MPEVVRNRNHLDFLNLSQGTMTVIEYEMRFNRLARDTPMMVARESDRCRHFEEGLNHKIWSQLAPGDFHNYQDLRAMAIRVERLIKEQEKDLASQRSKRSAKSQGGESSGCSGKKRKYDSTAQILPTTLRRMPTSDRGML